MWTKFTQIYNKIVLGIDDAHGSVLGHNRNQSLLTIKAHDKVTNWASKLEWAYKYV